MQPPIQNLNNAPPSTTDLNVAPPSNLNAALPSKVVQPLPSIPRNYKGVKYYAVAKGKQTGIFNDWTSTSAVVSGEKGAVFKAFINRKDAQDFLNNWESPPKKKAKMKR